MFLRHVCASEGCFLFPVKRYMSIYIYKIKTPTILAKTCYHNHVSIAIDRDTKTVYAPRANITVRIKTDCVDTPSHKTRISTTPITTTTRLARAYLRKNVHVHTSGGGCVKAFSRVSVHITRSDLFTTSFSTTYTKISTVLPVEDHDYF